VLETDAVRSEMKKLGVVPIKADYTRKNPLIHGWLQRYGKAGVPMYLVLPADSNKQPWTLPEALTTGIVVDALREAAGNGASGKK
jgi:thiol:disulfide interchange protein DsbD